MKDNSKNQFIKTWGATGYRENWDVYGKVCPLTQEQVADKIVKPFYNKQHVALEIGCGAGFWTDQYLAPNFLHVIALDVVPLPAIKSQNVTYIELPDRNFECYGVQDEVIDFAFQFGVFCHLSREAIQTYCSAIFKKLRHGGQAALYFSNNERRPHYKHDNDVPATYEHIQWCNNNMKRSIAMMEKAGFKEIRDLCPELPESMLYGRKP